MTRPLLTFYGDDFTGASAVMEVLSLAGLNTAMFLDPPGAETLMRYPGLQAVGIAGVARSKSPDWMRAHLPAAFRALAALGAPVAHYKVCSTFDSSPNVGSIGAATEIGREIFGGDWTPLVTGAPAIRRYQAFGNLFAGAGEGVFRLDRHPVMSRHPVTPMEEADLARHLAAQTDLQIGLIDLAEMKAGMADAAVAARIADGDQVLSIDVIDDDTLAEAGRLIWRGGAEQVFAVGSQGVEYALVEHWRRAGVIPEAAPQPAAAPVAQIFAVTGSCSPTTAGQIGAAEGQGFRVIPFDAAAAVDAALLEAERERVKTACLSLLSEGHDVLAATARGPDDPAVARMGEAVAASGVSFAEANERLGAALGRLVADIRRATGLPRIAVGGGDTSSHAMQTLGLEALSVAAPLAPGAPLCRAHAADPQIDGLELTLKGGQMGAPSFFIDAKY